MALVSPGVEITVIDESQYLPAALSTVPFVIIATAQNKLVNGQIAPGTTKTNAGKIYGISSQRELAATFGIPKFQESANGTSLHGDELNEYGLMAAYSALGLGNRAWVMRADIDTSTLKGTSVRPVGKGSNGANWFNTASTNWGIFEFDGTNEADAFIEKTVTVFHLDTNGSHPDIQSNVTPKKPKTSIGSIGDYASVIGESTLYVFKKGPNNAWNLLGSNDWADQIPSVVSIPDVQAGLGVNSSVPAGSDFVLNGTTVTFASNVVNATTFAANVTALTIAGITTDAVNNRVRFFVGATAANVELVATDGINRPLVTMGLMAPPPANLAAGSANVTVVTNGTSYTWDNSINSWGSGTITYRRPTVQFGSFAQMPSWRKQFASTARPNASVFVKTSVEGKGTNFNYSRYSSTTETWNKLAVKTFANGYAAINALDIAGGLNVAAGSVFAQYDSNPTLSGTANFKFWTLRQKGAVSATGAIQNPTFPGTASDYTFNIKASRPGQATPTTYSVTLGGTAAADFVSAVLAQNIPYLSASIVDGYIKISHSAGGIIELINTSGINNAISSAGFTTSVLNVTSGLVGASNSIVISNWYNTSYYHSLVAPFSDPADGTLWYYQDPTDVDIMINDIDPGTGRPAWRGYRNINVDARGYDLTQTSSGGVLVSASEPVANHDNLPLQPGDLWLDVSDLEKYPRIYRYVGLNRWALIDNTDRISQNGIIFADARWAASGLIDPISDILPSTKGLLTSDYLDLDAPNAALYPRGTLLFNTRRSGYTVKKFVADYFNLDRFGNSAILPTVRNAWISQLNFDSKGNPYMGHYAQRSQIVEAMKATLDGSTAAREESYAYNIIAAPGYPELIPNLVALNNDRSNTAFIIGDTPMNLKNTTNDFVEYSNFSAVTASPYLALYYPSALTNDLNGNEIAVPASHMMLRRFLYNDQVAYQWFAPAGTRRGLVDNALGIGYVDYKTGTFFRAGLNNAQRDTLYEQRMNPITLIPGVGLVVYGQKTRQASSASTGSALGSGTALDRVNVARMVNYLRTILTGVANQFLFEPNDKVTRDQVKQLIESILNDLIAKRGLYDYIVVCDETNNTSERIARNELYVDIAVEPMRAVEFIYIPIRLKNPGTISGTATTSITAG